MKPALLDGKRQSELRAKIRQLAGVPVVRHVAGRVAPRPPRSLPPLRDAALPTAPIVGIGASAGGPSALTALLCKLPGDYPGAVAVVQHLPSGFADAFAEFLRNRIALGVSVVRARTRIERSHVYLAPDDRHLVFDDAEHLTAFDAPPIGAHRPSADALLSSLAAVCGSRAIGIVLSGIGQDGVRGLMDLRARGALTLAQDAATSAVYGMPRAAAESGAAARSLDPEAMAKLLVALDARFGVSDSGARA
jgi:chemotaxis response regulator CheB